MKQYKKHLEHHVIVRMDKVLHYDFGFPSGKMSILQNPTPKGFYPDISLVIGTFYSLFYPDISLVISTFYSLFIEFMKW